MVGMQVGAATGITPGHAATHRHQILTSIFLHDRIRRGRTGVVLVMNMKSRSGDGVVGKTGKRSRPPLAIWPVHRRGMNAAVDLAAEILCQPSRADRSKAMSHHENLRKTVLVPEPGDDASHISHSVSPFTKLESRKVLDDRADAFNGGQGKFPDYNEFLSEYLGLVKTYENMQSSLHLLATGVVARSADLFLRPL